MTELESQKDFGQLGWHSGPHKVTFSKTDKSFRNCKLQGKEGWNKGMKEPKKKKKRNEGTKEWTREAGRVTLDYR